MAVVTDEKTQALHDQTLAKLQEKFSAGLVTSTCDYDFPVFTVENEIAHDVLAFLKNDSSLNYHFLTTLCTVHYPENHGKEFCLVYQLHNMPENRRIRVKTFVPENKLEISTVTDLWETANWMERQEYDFFGVKFTGHPNLVRILNMEDITFFPMRKEFPLEDQTRDDKNDSMFGR
jgi:NADH-quinone oxidoreductase subunit C